MEVDSVQTEVNSIQTEVVWSQKEKNQKEKNHVWLEVSELFELFVQMGLCSHSLTSTTGSVHIQRFCLFVCLFVSFGKEILRGVTA